MSPMQFEFPLPRRRQPLVEVAMVAVVGILLLARLLPMAQPAR